MKNKNKYQAIELSIHYDKTNKSSPYRLYASLHDSIHYFESNHFGAVILFVEGEEYNSRLVCGPPKHNKGFDIGTKKVSQLAKKYWMKKIKRISFKILTNGEPYTLEAIS